MVFNGLEFCKAAGLQVTVVMIRDSDAMPVVFHHGLGSMRNAVSSGSSVAANGAARSEFCSSLPQFQPRTLLRHAPVRRQMMRASRL